MELERLNNPRPVGPTDPVGDSTLRGGRIRPAAEDGSGLTVAADTIEISDRARELARAQQVAESATDVRSDRVTQIKQRVEDGTYSVPVELLAQRLIDSWSNDR